MTPTKLFKGLSTCLLRLCGSHLIILWLGLLSCQLVYAEACPVDSVITYDQNNEPIAKTIYQHDEAGRTTLTEEIKLADGIITSGTKTETEYYSNGKTKSTATWKWSNDVNDWIGIEKIYYEYNDYGSTTINAEYEWSDEQNTWVNKKKVEYVYNSNYKQIENTSYVGVGNLWIPTTKQEYDYDTRNHTILDRYWSGYDAAAQIWIGSSWKVWKYESTVYPNGVTLYEEYDWQNGAWNGKTKYDAEYDSKGRTILRRTYGNYNAATNHWDYVSEYHYAYDQWGNTTLNEVYSWKNDHWVGDSKIEVEYNADGEQLSQAVYAWDDMLRIWIGVSKFKKIIDANGNVLLDEQYTWSANDWVGTKKEEYTYDANKQVISTITYKWDVVKNTWGYNTKVLADYDSHKNQTKDERYQWAADASLPEGGYWKGTKYEVTTYNDKNVETDKITYQWDDTNRRWLGSSKSNYEFDAANHLVLEEQYTWVLDPSNPAGGYWQGTKKESFGYNAANQQIKHVTYEWGSTINNWIGKTKVLSNYDSNKNQTLNEQYTWTIDTSAEGGYWHGTVKEEYTFNKNKQQTSSLIYVWNDTNRNWDYVSKTKSEYDAKKNMILDERYEWQNGDWVGTLKKEYAYNAQGQQTMFAFYAWDEVKKAFVGTQKEETELDAEGRTILHATYMWGTNNWIGKSKNEYTYTATNLVAIEIASQWSNNTWVYSTKTDNNYTDNVLTSYIQYNWVNNAWVAAIRWEQVNADTERTYEWWNNNWSVIQETSKEYDGQNRLIRESDQNYSHGTQTSGSKTEYTYTGDKLTQKSSYIFESDWVETDRTTYTYSGNMVETISSTWTGTEWQGVERLVQEFSNERDYTVTQYEWKNGGWSGISKTGYTYYADGKEKSILIYRWSGTAWVEDTKTAYEYSGTKNIVTAMYQMENGSWVGQSKVGNYYDEGEDLTTATWTWTNGKWAPNTKLGESYDADGNLTGQTTYSKQGDDFIYNTKTEYEYGATTKDKTTATYKWNTTTNAWQGVSKSGVTYNGSKIASETTYTWISGLTWQPNQKKEYEYGVQAKDLTTAIYKWDATISNWVGVSKSGVTYASNGKIASEFSYTWNGTDWVGVTKTEYEYGDGKNNSVATYKGNGTEWVGVVKTSEVYTATGDSLGFYTYCWKDGAWADSLKTELTYDDHHNITYRINTQYTNGEWKNLATSTWWEITYDEKDRVLIDAHYTWNVSRKDWAGTGSRYVYEYDVNGNLILSEKDTWSSNKWTGSSKNEWEYNEKGMILQTSVWSWDKSKRKWKGISKTEYAYLADGTQTMSAMYTWNTSKWKWEGVTKSETMYDEKGNVIGSYQYKWSSSLWDWVGMFKYEYIYNENNKLLELTTSRYDTDWYYDTKTTYAYNNNEQLSTTSYTWLREQNKWMITFQSEKIYDKDANGKLRIEFDASWETDGTIKWYDTKINYYSCDPKFTITVQAEQEGEGEVTGSGIYTYYARPQIVAIDDPNCFIFTQWTDGETNATRRIIVIDDATYTAEFTPVERTTSASVKDNIGGSVKVTVE